MEVSAALRPLQNILEPALAFLSLDPLIRAMQFALGALATLLVFLVFWTTRDILQRTRALFYQLSCILLVAVLPVFGFFLYLLIRPTRTLAQKELQQSLEEVLELVQKRRGLQRTGAYVHTVKAKLKAKAEKGFTHKPADARHSSLVAGRATKGQATSNAAPTEFSAEK